MFLCLFVGILIGHYTGSYHVLYWTMIGSGLVLPMIGVMVKQLVIERAETALVPYGLEIYVDFALVLSVLVGIWVTGVGIYELETGGSNGQE